MGQYNTKWSVSEYRCNEPIERFHANPECQAQERFGDEGIEFCLCSNKIYPGNERVKRLFGFYQVI